MSNGALVWSEWKLRFVQLTVPNNCLAYLMWYGLFLIQSTLKRLYMPVPDTMEDSAWNTYFNLELPQPPGGLGLASIQGLPDML